MNSCSSSLQLEDPLVNWIFDFFGQLRTAAVQLLKGVFMFVFSRKSSLGIVFYYPLVCY